MGDVIEILTTATNTVEVEAAGPQGIPGVGVPSGGSTGQVLRKASGADYATEWATAGAGSGSVTSVALASTDLTISGSPITDSGTITANIAANAVTLEKLQTISSEHLLGRHGSGNGGVQQIGLGTGLAMSGSNVGVTFGSSAGTACQGNDSRLSDSRTPTAHAASHAAGIKASYNDQVAGMTDNVFIRADNVGTAGNSITLAFDGVDDIDTVLAAWNAANTSNTAELVSGDGTQVPDNGEEITLSGGVAAGSDPLSFIEISVTDPVSTETYTLKSGVPTFFGNIGFGIYSESSASFPFFTTPAGEVIFAGSSAFLGVADRTNAADRTLDKGLYGLNGCLNVYFQSLAKNTVSFGDNGDVLIGETNYNSPSVVAGVSSWGTKFQVNGNVAIQDNDNDVKATFDAQGNLTANRTYDLPDASGTLALTSDIPALGTGAGEAAEGNHTHGNLTNDGKLGSTAGLPLVTTTAGAVTTLALGTANQVLRVNSGATGVEFADPAAAGVTGAAASASDVLGVSGANITGVDAGSDRIVYWNNTSNKLAYGTPADAGAAAASHTHAASDITSGTIDTARLASGTANSGTFLRGDQTWAAAGGVTTGSVDNAVLRADGVGGSTSQSSDISILDATTTTENNVAITNQHSGQTNSSLVLTPKGTGAFIVGPRPDGTATGGNARGAGAICIQTSRNAANQVASAADSIAIGNRSRSSSALGESIAIGFSTTASGSYATCVGGRSTATSTYCTAVGHDADATQSGALALGDRTTSSSAGSIAIGSQANATNDRSIAIGESASCTGQYAIVAGFLASCSSNNAVVLGNSVSASLRAQVATPPFSAVYWSGQTTTNAATILNLDGTATNRFTIAASTALAVDILLVARRATTQDKWLVARRFLGIRRDGSNNTSLIGTVQTLGTDQSAGSPTWTFALTADDTNEALQLEVTGATGETVEWRATAFYRVA